MHESDARIVLLHQAVNNFSSCVESIIRYRPAESSESLQPIITEASTIIGILRKVATSTIGEQGQSPLALLTERTFSDNRRQLQRALGSLKDLASGLERGWSDGLGHQSYSGKAAETRSDTLTRIHTRLRDSRLGLLAAIDSIRLYTALEANTVPPSDQHAPATKDLRTTVFDVALQKIAGISSAPIDINEARETDYSFRLIEELAKQRHLKVVRSWCLPKQFSSYIGQLVFCVRTYQRYDDGHGQGVKHGKHFTAEYRFPVYQTMDRTFLQLNWYNGNDSIPSINITVGKTKYLPFQHGLCRAIEHGDLESILWKLHDLDRVETLTSFQNRSLSMSILTYSIFCSEMKIAEFMLSMWYFQSDDVLASPSWTYLKRELLREVSHGNSRSELILKNLRHSLPYTREAFCPSLDQLLKAVLSRDHGHVEKANCADLDRLGVDGYNPLHLAAILNDGRMIKTLCSMGADVQLTDVLGKTALHFVCEAVEFNHLSAQTLCDLGADVNVQDLSGYTPLHCATARNSSKAVEFLLRCGADPNIPNFTRGDTPLNMLSDKKGSGILHLQMIQTLVEFGAEVDLADDAGTTPLMNAIKNPYSRIFVYLHEVGASLNKVDVEGKSILHYAAIWGRAILINYLASTCEVNVDPDLVDGLGRRAIDLMQKGTTSEWEWCYRALKREPKDCASFNDVLSNIRAAQSDQGSEGDWDSEDDFGHSDHELSEFELQWAESIGVSWDYSTIYNTADEGSSSEQSKGQGNSGSGSDHNSAAYFASVADGEFYSQRPPVFSTDKGQIETQQAVVVSHKQLNDFGTGNDSVRAIERYRPLPPNPPTLNIPDTVDGDDSSDTTSETETINTRGETISTDMSSAILTQASTRRQLALKEIARLLSKRVGVARTIRAAAEDAEISFRVFNSALKLSFREFSVQFSLESGGFPTAARFLNVYTDTIATTTLEEMKVSFSRAKFQVDSKPDHQEWLTDYEAGLEFELSDHNLLEQLQRQDQLSRLPDMADDIPDFTNEPLRDHLLNSRAIEVLKDTFHNLTYPSFYRIATQLVVRSFQPQASKADIRQADMPRLLSLIADISHANPSDADLRKSDANSWMNTAKLAVERLTGQDWDWGPWHPPCETLARNHVRLEWRCNCGEIRSANLPLKLATQLQQLIKKHSGGNSQSPGHSGFDSALQMTATSTSQHHSPMELQGLTPGGNQTDQSTSGAAMAAARTDGQTRGSRQEQTRPRYIFLVVSSDRHRLSQLNAADHDTHKFAHDLRTEYNRLRGFWRSWFSIFKFSHCDFVKFEKFCPFEYEHRGLGLPDCEPHANDYWFRPRPPECSNPPIGPEEFRHIFYFYPYRPFISQFKFQDKSLVLLAQPAVRWPRFFAQIPPLFRNLRERKLPTDTMQRIPQRFRYFEEGAVNRESLWGLHAREKPSVLMALLYMTIFLSPSLVFCFIYLFGLGGEIVDLQNATAPFTISMTFISMFIGWLAVGGRDTPEKANVR